MGKGGKKGLHFSRKCGMISGLEGIASPSRKMMQFTILLLFCKKVNCFRPADIFFAHFFPFA